VDYGARARDAAFRRLGIDAVHWPAGAAPGATVRLLLESNHPGFPAGAGRVVVDRVTAEVRAAELAAVAAGDWLNAGGIWYRIEPNPERDAEGVWQLGLRRSESGP
jgi:hypothetical protein